VEELEDLPFGADLAPTAQQELHQGKLPGELPSTSLATPCGCRNPFTSGDLDLGRLVDQPADSIQPCGPDAGWWNGQGSGSQRWCLAQ